MFNTISELIISAHHLVKDDSFVIEIQENKVDALIKEFNTDFKLLTEHLKIMNKRMVLLNPVITLFKYH
jgi:hypothetical protein